MIDDMKYWAAEFILLTIKSGYFNNISAKYHTSAIELCFQDQDYGLKLQLILWSRLLKCSFIFVFVAWSSILAQKHFHFLHQNENCCSVKICLTWLFLINMIMKHYYPKLTFYCTSLAHNIFCELLCLRDKDVSY